MSQKKNLQIRKEEVKLSFFKKTRCSEQKTQATHTHTPLLQLINKFSKAAGYKTNIQKQLSLSTKQRTMQNKG